MTVAPLTIADSTIDEQFRRIVDALVGLARSGSRNVILGAAFLRHGETRSPLPALGQDGS